MLSPRAHREAVKPVRACGQTAGLSSLPVQRERPEQGDGYGSRAGRVGAPVVQLGLTRVQADAAATTAKNVMCKQVC